jgi:hypothetical protein
LTFQQQSLWRVIHQYPDWKCAVTYAFCIQGTLDIAALEGSLREVTQRHSSLRARISMVDGLAQIETLDGWPGQLEILSVEGRTRDDIQSHAKRIFAALEDRVVDPAAGPLLSVKLLVLAADEHWLIVAVHRLVADCFSAEQMLQELWALYPELSQGRLPPPLPQMPQYSDYARWQQSHGQEWLQRHEDYWKKRLAGATSVQWPTDGAAALGKRGATGMMSIHLGAQLSHELQGLARRTRSLAAMVMLAVYVSVLWRWCGQRDFVLPFYVAGRQSEHKAVVGYFSHVLYLRIQLTGQESFSALMALVSNEFFRALSHQDFGKQATERPDLLAGVFCQWVTWHQGAPRDTQTAAQTSPLASSFTVERLPLSEFGQGLSILPPGMVDVDLTFFDTAQGVYAQGVYRADRFTSQSMDRLMGDLRDALALFVQDPGANLSASSRFQHSAPDERRLSCGSSGS